MSTLYYSISVCRQLGPSQLNFRHLTILVFSLPLNNHIASPVLLPDAYHLRGVVITLMLGWGLVGRLNKVITSYQRSGAHYRRDSLSSTLILEPRYGLEPQTWSLQMTCSTNWANKALQWCEQSSAADVDTHLPPTISFRYQFQWSCLF